MTIVGISRDGSVRGGGIGFGLVTKLGLFTGGNVLGLFVICLFVRYIKNFNKNI